MEKLNDKDIDPAITDEYEIGETLGTGHFSKVKLGTHKQTGEKVAIKIIVKPKDNKMHVRALAPPPPVAPPAGRRPPTASSRRRRC